MDLNELFIVDLSQHIGVPVEQDEYEGNKDTYCVFIYEDERPCFFGDNEVQNDITYIRLTLYIPKNKNYFTLKKEITKFLEQRGFFISSRFSRLDTDINNQNKIRSVVFQLQITGEHE